MFVRVRQSGSRLQLSLVETHRAAGKVRHEHVASLGSVPVSPSVADRLAFWRHLHERLCKLANRLDDKSQDAILEAVHARIAMVTIEEIRALQLENAKADAELWESLRDAQAETVEDHKRLIANAEHAVAEGEAQVNVASEGVADAKDRIDRLECGEEMTGGLERQSVDEILASLGWSAADWRHAARLSAIYDIGAWNELCDEIMRRHRRSELGASRAVLKRHQQR
jgi:hypothetical protein